MIDRAGRTVHLTALRGIEPALVVDEAIAAAGRLCRRRGEPLGAPVLALPGQLDPALCHRLVTSFGAAVT
nr:hypothetical protein [uncultured Lichenicoccus sp.]